MEDLKYNLPESCFPRYQYTKTIRQGLAKRYNDLRNKFGCESMPQLQDIGDAEFEKISIFISFPVLKEFPLITTDILEKAEGLQPDLFELQTGLDRETMNTHSFVIISQSIIKGEIIPESLKSVPAHTHLILIAESERAKANLSHTFKDKKHIHVCLEEHVRQEILIHLERYAFTGMKSACEFLDSVLTDLDYSNNQDAVGNMKNAKIATKDDDHNSKNSGLKRSLSAQGKLQKCHHTSPHRTQSASGTSRYKSDYDQSRTSCRLYQLRNENKELIETIERLNDEIIGMFNRSLLPIDEHPYLMISKEKNVNEKLLQDLQLVSLHIRSCGYRFSTFQVYVDCDPIPDELKNDIVKKLKQYKITTYSIVSLKINLFANYRAGSKVSVKSKDAEGVCLEGTLGGFARTSSEESQQLWVLMSKHILNENGDGYLYIDGERVAEIMKYNDPNKPYIDITAACVEKKLENQCDTKYITEQNRLVKGRLCCYDPSKLKGLPVHIRGASTNLGLGTVTVSKKNPVHDNCEDEYYIVVEDRDSRDGGEKVPFCKEGDSGAMVCADSPDNYGEEVQLISMVSGENISKKGSYYTVRLDRGIAELDNVSGKKFELL